MSKKSESSIVERLFVGVRSVKGRIMLIGLVPTLAALFLGTQISLERLGEVRDANSVIEAFAIAPIVSEVAHSLQEERGYSAGFLGRSRDAFAQYLLDARSQTNQAIAVLRAQLTNSGANGDTALEEATKKVLTALDQIGDMREQVDSSLTSVSEMAAVYTGAINALIDVQELVARRAKTVELTNKALSYISLVQAIESAGLERAQGAAGFGNGEFGQSNYQKFITQGANSNVRLDEFLAFATQEEKAAFQQFQDSDASERVNELRQAAFGQPFGGSLQGMSGLDWFEAATQRISSLIGVEKIVLDELLHEAEIEAGAARFLLGTVLAINGAILIATMVLGIAIIRSITGPMGRLKQSMNVLAQGEFDIEVPGVESVDEIGDMARAVEVFKQSGIDRQRLEGESEKEQQARMNRQQNVDSMIEMFRSKVEKALVEVAANTDQMGSTATRLTAIAKDTTAQAADAVNASHSASENVQTVAAATEELSASIDEISSQVSNTNTIVNNANEAANATNDKVTALAAAAQKIGNVISLIQDIAERTNLLALNTSIEAARAGEAGKGFAVVASEVKSLANQTATATGEISAQIANIQSSTSEAVAGIAEITRTMAEVNSYTSSIASAIEEQGAATMEISQSISQAATGTKQVVSSMQVVTSSVGETNSSAAQVMEASEGVSSQATNLRNTIDTFLSEVNAA